MKISISLLLAFAACAAPSSPPPPKAPAPAVVEQDEWATSSWDDRHDTMEFVVHPNMARLFQANAHKPYPDMTCRTCHGADAETVNYKMPHGLMPLDPAHLPEDKFMTDEVTPKMIELMGTSSRTFGCFSCHARQK